MSRFVLRYGEVCDHITKGAVFTYAEPEDESVSQDEAASGNSVSDDGVEAETEEAATGDPDPEFVMATSWDGIQKRIYQ